VTPAVPTSGATARTRRPRRAGTALRATAVVELRLFVREPVSVVFALALPLVIFFVLNGVFGNTPSPKVWGGIGAIDFYTPAYVAIVLASIGFVSLPTHLAGYRERGVLRRFRASSISPGSVLAAQLVVALVVGLAASALLLAVAIVGSGATLPRSWVGVVVAFVAGLFCLASVGLLLGCVVPTARAAQGGGVLVWWALLIISGGGPPPEVLPAALRTTADIAPLKHVTTALQDAWLHGRTNWAELALVTGIGAACWAVARFALAHQDGR
jgi:ABC-2 type transport system permease protein